MIQIIRWALNTRINSICADKLISDNLATILKNISRSMLFEWNLSTNSFDGKKQNIFEKWLSYRLTVEEDEVDSIFHRRTNRILNEPDKPAVLFNGKSYPNPYYYVVNYDLFCDRFTDDFVVGKIHGDLHLGNVFVSADLYKVDEFCLIDFDTYQEDNCLLFDHAYLEYSVMQKQDIFKGETLDSWVALFLEVKRSTLEPVENPKHVNLPAICIRNSIAKGIKDWAEIEIGMIDRIEIQYLLAKIAVGINYLCKRAINDDLLYKRAFLYSSINLEKLFELLKFEWNKNSVTSFINEATNKESLWNACEQMEEKYVKILFTDGVSSEESKKLVPLVNVHWSAIIDLGTVEISKGLFGTIVPLMKKKRNVTVLYKESKEVTSVGENSCIWLDTKSDTISNYKKSYQKKLLQTVKHCKTVFPLSPLMIIVACRENVRDAERQINWLLEEDGIINEGTTVITLGKQLADNVIADLKSQRIHYKPLEIFTIIDLADILRSHGVAGDIDLTQSVSKRVLPGNNNDRYEIEDANLAYWNSSVQVIYPGIEGLEMDYDYGRSFYRGKMISWTDLANCMDIQVDLDSNKSSKNNYAQVIEKTRDELNRNSTSVQYLLHGAGSGGTTYARRLAWDLKNTYPCVAIKKLTSDTSNILCDIYRKTGRIVFCIAEIGASIIAEDDVYTLAHQVNRENCNVFLLCVMRSENTANEKDAKRHELFRLPSEMTQTQSVAFLTKYASYAKDENCVQALKEITYTDTLREQRNPVMYGFYALLDQYIGIDDFIKKEVDASSEIVLSLLSDLSIVTCYSQNLTISYVEIAARLGLSFAEAWKINDLLGAGILHLLSPRNNGYRICHKLIADKIISAIYLEENRIYDALKAFIDNKIRIYGDEESYVNEAYKEIFIVRSDVDGGKQKFSNAILDIVSQHSKKNIIAHLKESYPNNPYYLTQLGRLYTSDRIPDYSTAISHLEQAIKVAEENELEQASHHTTLGSIFARRLNNWLHNNIKNGNRTRWTLEEALNKISADFTAASNQFLLARTDTPYSTYSYFPQIQMISSVLTALVDYFGDVNNLVKQEPFGKWYSENIRHAIDLYEQMEERCSDEDFKRFKDSCMTSILHAQCDIDSLQKRNVYSRQDKAELNRAISSLLMVNINHAPNSNTQTANEEIVRLMYDNIINNTYEDGDIYKWFNAYRLLTNFDKTLAVNTLTDCLKDSYKKYYYLYLLNFSFFEQGLMNYHEFEKSLTQCQNYSKKEYGLKTAKVIDTVFSNVPGFAIRPIRTLSRSENEWDTRPLKTYTGLIKTVNGSTDGRAIIDRLGIVVFFAPIVNSRGKDGNHVKTHFTKSDEGKKIAFKLMFSYDGPKAWSVEETDGDTQNT